MALRSTCYCLWGRKPPIMLHARCMRSHTTPPRACRCTNNVRKKRGERFPIPTDEVAPDVLVLEVCSGAPASCDWASCPSSICTFVSAQTRRRTHHLSRDVLCYCGVSLLKHPNRLCHSSPPPSLSTGACLSKFSLEEAVEHFSSDFTLPASTSLKILLRAIDKTQHINFWTVV